MTVPRPPHRRLARRRLVLALGATLAVGGPRVARACEFFCTSLRVDKPWTRATDEGDAFAVLCMTFDDIRVDERLVGVQTPVARGVLLHDATTGLSRPVDLPLPAGRTVVLDESALHLRLTGLAHALGVGREYPMTLVFERAGELRADIDVAYEKVDGRRA